MIKIKGYSGFNINIEEYDFNKIISKSSDNNFERLKKQANKQINYYNKYMKKIEAETPKILLIKNNKILMEYIYYSENIVDFLFLGNIRKIDWLINKLISIVENYIDLCHYDYVKSDILLNKIKIVDKNLKENININYEDLFIKNSLNYLYDNIDAMGKIKIPIGICHGDLSLSNILIDLSEMKIYLIDFLDSFIDSPMLDIVKLRQDSKFYWILEMYSDNIDINNLIISLNYIDSKLDNYFKKYYFYNESYKFYEILNILRVLQYSKNPLNIKIFKK